MPKLIVFAACERVILDAEGLVSLITLVERVQIDVPSSVDLSKPMVYPMRWATLAVWTLEPNEVKQCEQKTELYAKDDTLCMHSDPQVLQPSAPSATGSKVVSHLTMIPINQGPLELRLYARRLGDPNWTLYATYPIEVQLSRV